MTETSPPQLGRTMRESEPSWPAEPSPGPGTPNVVFCVFDDVGYSDFACYGSEISHPEHRPARRRRTSIHELPHHVAVLSDARLAAHRT